MPHYDVRQVKNRIMWNYVNNVFVDLIEMFFSKDDLAVIVACCTEKGWTATQIAKEFPNKKWNYRKKTFQSNKQIGSTLFT